MIHQSYVGEHRGDAEDWRASAANVCLQIGLTMIGLALLYWGLIIVHASSLGSGWVAALFARDDPLASLGDPFMWALWLVYWTVAFGLLRRGLAGHRPGPASN